MVALGSWWSCLQQSRNKLNDLDPGRFHSASSKFSGCFIKDESTARKVKNIIRAHNQDSNLYMQGYIAHDKSKSIRYPRCHITFSVNGDRST